MIAISVELLADRYHATPWGRAANEGDVEWPPSPWRLARGLVAAWYRLPDHERPDEDDLVEALRALAPPPRFVLPPASVGQTRHYMPLAEHGPKVETRLVLDAFVRTAPQAVVMTWPHQPGTGVRETLDALLPGLGYLGRAESPCVATLRDDAPEGALVAVPLEQAEGEGGEIVRLLCLDEQPTLAGLSTSTAELRQRRTQAPPDGRFVDYLRSARALDPPRQRTQQPSGKRVQFLRFALQAAAVPPVSEALRLGELFRAVALRQADGLPDEAVGLLRGKIGPDGAPATGHRHCHYLSTDEDGDGRLDHLTVWCPDDLGARELRALDVRRLGSWWVEHPIHLVLVASGLRSGHDPGPLARGTVWESHTPFLPPRHRKRRGGVVRDDYPDQVALELRRRNLPEPAEVTPVRTGHRHWGEFRRERGRREARGDLPAMGFRLRFHEPVSGPISLGRNSHFGMGLFMPST